MKTLKTIGVLLVCLSLVSPRAFALSDEQQDYINRGGIIEVNGEMIGRPDVLASRRDWDRKAVVDDNGRTVNYLDAVGNPVTQAEWLENEQRITDNVVGELNEHYQAMAKLEKRRLAKEKNEIRDARGLTVSEKIALDAKGAKDLAAKMQADMAAKRAEAARYKPLVSLEAGRRT